MIQDSQSVSIVTQINGSWIEKSESVIKYSLYVLVLAGVFLDILVMVKRSHANKLFYFELVWTLLLSMTPVAMGAQAAKQTFAFLIV